MTVGLGLEGEGVRWLPTLYVNTVTAKNNNYRPVSPDLYSSDNHSEISSSHGGEYDVQSCLQGYTAV
jgi:hypothetical protein